MVWKRESARSGRDHAVAGGGTEGYFRSRARGPMSRDACPFLRPRNWMPSSVIVMAKGHFEKTYTLILLATCAKPVSLSASVFALCIACFRSSILFLETSS